MSVGAFEDSAKELDSKSLGWTSRNSEGIHNVTCNDKKDIPWHPALASSASKALFLETNCCCIKPTSPNLGEIHVEQSNMSKIMHCKSLHVYILYTLRTRGQSVQQLQHVGKVQILTGWILRCLERRGMQHTADPADPAGISVQVGFRGVHTSFTATIMEPTMT